MKVRSHWIPCGSRPLEGSSRMRISGSPSRAVASCSRWRMPIENLPTRRRATSDRPTSSRVSPTRREGSRSDGHHLEVVFGPPSGVETGRFQHGAYVVKGLSMSTYRRPAKVAVPWSWPQARAGSAEWWSCRSHWGRGNRLPGRQPPRSSGRRRPNRAELLGQIGYLDGRGHARRYRVYLVMVQRSRCRSRGRMSIPGSYRVGSGWTST